MNRNAPCPCGLPQKCKRCHRCDYPNLHYLQSYQQKYGITIKSLAQVRALREAAHCASTILDEAIAHIRPGISTAELNRFVHARCLHYGAQPAPLGYGTPPFPASVCISKNDVVCHGIPSENEILEDGDIVNLDVSCNYQGYYGDLARMVCIGNVAPAHRQLVDVTYAALLAGIAAAQPGAPLNAIGEAICATVAPHSYGVVEEYVGHGIGATMHEPPNIFHCHNHDTTPIAPGMVFTIEPLINLGSAKTRLMDDHWTVKTFDNSFSAQWEHTIWITEDGPVLLTHHGSDTPIAHPLLDHVY